MDSDGRVLRLRPLWSTFTEDEEKTGGRWTSPNLSVSCQTSELWSLLLPKGPVLSPVCPSLLVDT